MLDRCDDKLENSTSPRTRVLKQQSQTIFDKLYSMCISLTAFFFLRIFLLIDEKHSKNVISFWKIKSIFRLPSIRIYCTSSVPVRVSFFKWMGNSTENKFSLNSEIQIWHSFSTVTTEICQIFTHSSLPVRSKGAGDGWFLTTLFSDYPNKSLELSKVGKLLSKRVFY